MSKILIALQFWQGDKEPALRLARYLADLEPKHCELADFLLVNRFDCASDPATIQYLSRKFNTYQHRSTRRGTGWPHGCNSLFFGTMEWVWSMMEARRVPRYKAIFTCEGDGAPVSRNWVERMSLAWDAANQEKKVYVAGPYIPAQENGMHDHINGNTMISGDSKFLTWLVKHVSDVHPQVGWDYILSEAFKRWGWADVTEMKSIYNTPHFSEQQFCSMIDQKWIWVHGDKSGDLIKHGRKYFLNQV